jgi:hypothetical protein
MMHQDLTSGHSDSNPLAVRNKRVCGAARHAEGGHEVCRLLRQSAVLFVAVVRPQIRDAIFEILARFEFAQVYVIAMFAEAVERLIQRSQIRYQIFRKKSQRKNVLLADTGNPKLKIMEFSP